MSINNNTRQATTSTDATEARSPNMMNRRRYLALLAGGTVGLAGCGGRSPDEPEPETPQPTSTPEMATPDVAESFDRVLDVVDDLGCDPTGESPCDRTITEATSSNTLFRFPAGRYRFADGIAVDGYSRLGFVGEGKVRLVPPEGFNHWLLDVDVGEFLIDNFDIDIRQSDVNAGIRAITETGFRIENVEHVGRGTHSAPYEVDALVPVVKDPSGVGIVRNYVAEKGSAWGHYGNGRTGIYIGRLNRGTIRVIDCHFEEFGGAGIYATATQGNVQVVGGTFKNNNVASIRLGGDGSYVDGARIEIDLDQYTGPRTQEQNAFRLRGIIINQKSAYIAKPGGAEIRNCSIHIRKAPSPGPAIAIMGPARESTIRDTEIRVDTPETPAIHRFGRVSFEKHPPSEDPRWIRLENVRIAGKASGRAAVIVEGAPGSILRGCDIVQTGEGRDGIHIVASGNCVLDGGSVVATRYPVGVDPGPSGSDGECYVDIQNAPKLASRTEDTAEVRLADGTVLPCLQSVQNSR